MTWMLAALCLLQDPAERHEKARARLLEMLVSARAEKQEADETVAAAEQNKKRAEQLLERALKSSTDEAARKIVQDLIPKMIEDARCLAERSAESSAAAGARIRLTEKALANLKAPAPSGPLDLALRKWSALRAKATDAAFAESHGFKDDPAAEKRLSDLLDRVHAFAPFAGERPKLKIVKGSYNGFAAFTTTDTIYVLENELDRKPGDASLLITLGHELAHVQMGHYAAFDLHHQKQDWIQSFLDSPDQTAMMHDEAVAKRTSAYSVEQELEAEILGAQMAIAAGVPPSTILKSLEAEAAHRARADAAKPARERERDRLVRDHPDPKETLDKLREVLGPAAAPR